MITNMLLGIVLVELMRFAEVAADLLFPAIALLSICGIAVVLHTIDSLENNLNETCSAIAKHLDQLSDSAHGRDHE